MPVPSYHLLIEPLLRFLAANPDGVKASAAYEAVANDVGLTDEDRAKLLPSGAQEVYKNRIGWANDRLKRAEFAESPRRGWWQITQAGIEFAQKYPDGVPKDEIDSMRKVARTSKLKQSDDEDAPTATLEDDDADTQSPEERIEHALKELTDSVGADLLSDILKVSPSFFERLVLDVLHAMGYGTSRSDLQQVGGSGDGGIDGIISLDRLGLEKVYVQAKRWKNTVGRPEIQGFFGALAGRRANKGVFITTSGYTREAREFANQVSDSIVLVDGKRLTALMIEHGVGVSHKLLRLPKMDSDYFEEG